MKNRITMKQIQIWLIAAFLLLYTGQNLFLDASVPVLALHNGYLINGNGGLPMENAVILIRGQKIIAVGKKEDIAIPTTATRINLKGKAVMPGLADMHVHFMGGWDGKSPELLGFRNYLHAYLFSGVTTIMDMGNIPPYILQIRDAVKSGRILGPQIYCVGPLIDGVDAQWPAFSVSIASIRQIPGLVRRLKDRHVTFLKAYKGLSFRQLDQLVDDGKKSGLDVIVDQGFLNASLDLCTLNIAAFAHVPGQRRITDKALDLMKRNGIRNMTTLSVLEYYAHERIKNLSFLRSPLIKATTAPWMRQQLTAFATVKRTVQAENKIAYFKKVLALAKKNVLRLHKAGIPLIAGTDAPYPGVFQGESIHRELELLVDSGLTPLEAITCATRNAAVFVGDDKKWGTLEIGKLANLLIIDGRPDRCISDSRKIVQVILKGKPLERKSMRYNPNHDFRPQDSVETEG